MSFASEPERDDGSLPPVNVEIPDDARELARDVIAYHRELRAKRRRERMTRALRPLSRQWTILPVIATCVALSLVVGSMLSLMTVGPASAPTTAATPPAATSLPQDPVKADGAFVPVSSLKDSVLVLIPLIPPWCGCGPVLSGIASQAARGDVAVYFVYDDTADLAQTADVTADYGDGVARTVYDVGGLLFFDYAPTSLVALFVARDGTVKVRRAFPPGFDLSPALTALNGTH